MYKFLKLSVLLCLLLLPAFGATPKVGDKAPEFSLAASDGRSVALRDYAGKKLVLVFYRGYW